MIPKILLFLFILILPNFVWAQDTLGETRSFDIESSYDLSKRQELPAVLIKISPQLYWYADNAWWSELAAEEQDRIKVSLNVLTEEFENRIYPILTDAFGSEWNPGIDRDSRITILIHPMKKNSGGYTDTADEYPKVQSPESNEREMIYLNSDYIGNDIMKSFLAHEFVHLITFNQKDRAFNVSDDVWLSEARAEYAPTLLGYDQNYNGSNLQARVRDFLNSPFDSLVEWRESPADYGVLNLFTQYMIDHYGIKVFVDSLKIQKTGIDSLNTALSRNGFKTDFQQIFTEWAIAALINDCDLSEKYCYFNNNLKNFRVTPLVNYLPLVGDSVLSVNSAAKDWAGNWHKFIGGKGRLEVEFDTGNTWQFRVPYVIEDSQGNLSVNNLLLDADKKGRITLEDFGDSYKSLTIIPIAQNKIAGFEGIQPSYSFFWSASAKSNASEKAEVPAADRSREQQAAALKAQIIEVQLKIIDLLRQLIQLLLTQLNASANM
jgi:hypothetical protein